MMSTSLDIHTPVIVAATRTPIGRLRGALARLRPDDMGAAVVPSLLESSGIEAAHIEDLYYGCTNQSGEDSRNVARMIGLLAGLPIEVPGVTLNRLCGSGMEALVAAAKSVMVQEGEVYLAGGGESMSRAPFVLPKSESAFPVSSQIYNTALGWRMENPRMKSRYGTDPMGITAEKVARSYEISREDQDAWAFQSHQRAKEAQESGAFSQEICPLRVPQGRKKPDLLVEQDECIRPDTTLERLAKLTPAFEPDGCVTAGNASPLSDGASAMLVTSLAYAKSHGLKPLARVVSWGHAGVEPSLMGMGPVPASKKALERAGLQVADIDLFELNEAFASQVLACVRALSLDPAKVNVRGGAIALGHPLGCSGARIVTTLVHSLHAQEKRYGLATMCIGVGQGIACVLERL